MRYYVKNQAPDKLYLAIREARRLHREMDHVTEELDEKGQVIYEAGLLEELEKPSCSWRTL